MRAKTVNESLSPEEKREAVMKIMKDRDIEVSSGSFVKFHDLSLTDLTPEEIVNELITEQQEFERGKDPKKAMGVGFTNIEDYVKRKLQEIFPNENVDKMESSFWEMVADGYDEWKSYEIHDSIMDILKETPPKYQMEWISGDLEEFETGVEEGYITI